MDFTAFYRDNYWMVVGVALRRVDSPDDAEEIAAAAFRVAWERHSSGEDVNVPWLYGVVRNLVGNEYRRRNRQAALMHRATDELRGGGGPDPSDDTSERAERLRDIVAKLPEKHREVIEMAYWDELPGQTIADYLGISAGAFHTRISRARDALRRLIDEEGGL